MRPWWKRRRAGAIEDVLPENDAPGLTRRKVAVGAAGLLLSNTVLTNRGLARCRRDGSHFDLAIHNSQVRAVELPEPATFIR